MTADHTADALDLDALRNALRKDWCPPHHQMRAALDRLEAAEAHIRELEPAIDRVRRLHSQHSDLGLAPGKWCPGCGHEEPCPTVHALRGEQ